jgi:acetyl esterase/lipase
MPAPRKLAHTRARFVRLAGALVLAATTMSISARDQRSATTRTPTPVDGTGHLAVDSRIEDLLRHRAFAGFGRQLLPWDDRAPDSDLPLSRFGTLLPYHTHVDPKAVVDALNHMIDAARDGDTVFHDIYTAADKQRHPDKRATGLLFFRGRPGAPFAIIAPGGGFTYVASLHEGFPYAHAIARAGYNAFVLKYRVGQGGGAATEDLAAAITHVFRNAELLGVSKEHYALWGSSAGARMAASIGSHGVSRFGGDELPKPSTVVMAYTGHADHSTNEPATFVAVGEQDNIVPASVMERRVAQLRRGGTSVEFHRYPGVGHGFGLGIGTSAEGWIDDAIRFWQTTMRPQ